MSALLLLPTPQAAARWLSERCTGTLRSDSRAVRPGDAFVGWPGAQVDGRRFVADALAAGAGACVVEAEGASSFGLDPQRVALLHGLKAAAGELADLWFRQPTAQLRVFAVTGTNGKTSSAWWIAQALGGCGVTCGVIGTLGIGVPPTLVDACLTTPDPLALQSAFADFVAQGFEACAIEASSIGLAEGRLAGTRITIAGFTNFTQDHLDYHGDMASYWAAKRRLFDWPGLQAAVVNIDDPQGAALAAELGRPGGDGARPVLWTVSTQRAASLRAGRVRYVDGALAFDVEEAGQRVAVRTRLVGDFNVHNLLVVLAALRAAGIALQPAAESLQSLLPVPGRMQRIEGTAAQPEIVVDYAHTPDALRSVLASLAPWATARDGVLWCVFGCGGNRDLLKRPLMGAIAAELAGRVVVTSDNPRGEPPARIIEQILAGIAPVFAPRVHAEADRRVAITQVVTQASARDVVLIAGKGHEAYQEVAGRRLPFSDAQVAREALAAREVHAR